MRPAHASRSSARWRRASSDRACRRLRHCEICCRRRPPSRRSEGNDNPNWRTQISPQPSPPEESRPTAVEIVVAYLEDGSPRVWPVEALVRVSGTIAWRTVDDEMRPFTSEKKPGPSGWEGDAESLLQPGDKYPHGGHRSEERRVGKECREWRVKE